MFFKNRPICSLIVSIGILISSLMDSSAYASSPSQNCKLLLSKRSVVVVNAYSSGRFLPEHIKKAGYDVVHIHSEAPTGLLRTFDASHVTYDLRYDGNLDQLIQILRQHAPIAVLPGAESGVLLSDEISAALHSEFGVPSNGILKARRDKYEMGETLRKHSIPAVLQMQTHDVEQALAWIKTNHLLPGKVVLKPTMSAGSEGVVFCKNETEVREAFAKIYSSINSYKIVNQTVLVQEYLQGIEYVVNTVSSRGKHVVTDIWQYHKEEIEGAGTIYNYDELLPFEGQIQQELVAYTLRVLDAMGIQTGWGHAEIKMTERGPILVEIGNRMMGSGQPQLVQKAIGQSQIELGVEAYLFPERFAQRPLDYLFRQYAYVINLSTYEEGHRLSVEATPEIQALPGYVSHSFMFKEGDILPRTVDMNTSYGQVNLVHPDSKTIHESLLRLRQIQAEGRLFKN